MCPTRVDAVEKRFCGLERTTLIQNRRRVHTASSVGPGQTIHSVGQLLPCDCHQGRARHPTHAAAEDSYRHALEVARRQSAKFWELRAAMSLARLWRDQGKRDEAHDLLAPVYGWFTEGFDTPVLKKAKLLLEQIAA